MSESPPAPPSPPPDSGQTPARPGGPQPAPEFVLHRTPGGGGGASSGIGLDRRARLLLAMGVLFAVGWAGHWVTFQRPGPQRPLLPKSIERVRLGMMIDELEALGGMPSARPGEEVHSVYFSLYGQRGGIGGGLSDAEVEAKTTFDGEGKLVHFEALADDVELGAPVGASDLLALAPVLANVKMIRRPYPLKELEDALGPGRPVGRILDAEEGETIVLRWDSATKRHEEGTRMEARVRDGIVVAHELGRHR